MFDGQRRNYPSCFGLLALLLLLSLNGHANDLATAEACQRIDGDINTARQQAHFAALKKIFMRRATLHVAGHERLQRTNGKNTLVRHLNMLREGPMPMVEVVKEEVGSGKVCIVLVEVERTALQAG